MSAPTVRGPRSSPSPPRHRPSGPACSPVTSSSPSTAGRPETSSSTACWSTSPSPTSRSAGRPEPSLTLQVAKEAGEPLGVEVSSAVFDRVRTCDNHCEFCFIYQLPKGMRRSLYLKDDDYRLSFLYGNFTTLTRFTELDLERVLTERLSPLFVSIHATDPELRARLLRNRRGATSLRWLRALLDGGIEVHGQVVVCPGVNDGAVLEDTLAGVLDEYPELATVACVPLGVSHYTTEPAMRPTPGRRRPPCSTRWRSGRTPFLAALGRRLVFAADEYYLLAGRPFPPAAAYDGFPQHENGIGMARAFEAAFGGRRARRPSASGPGSSPRSTAPRPPATGPPRVDGRRSRGRPGGARRPSSPASTGPGCSGPWSTSLRPRRHPGASPVANHFFGGNIAVTGLLTGADLARVLATSQPAHRYLLPDACLSEGRFLDGLTVDDLPRPVEVVPTDGLSLRRAGALGGTGRRRPCPPGARAVRPVRAPDDGSDAGRRPAPGGDRRAAQRGQVDAGQPDRRATGGRGGGEARGHPRPAELDAEWDGRPFIVVDTGGWLAGATRSTPR